MSGPTQSMYGARAPCGVCATLKSFLFGAMKGARSNVKGKEQGSSILRKCQRRPVSFDCLARLSLVSAICKQDRTVTSVHQSRHDTSGLKPAMVRLLLPFSIGDGFTLFPHLQKTRRSSCWQSVAH